MLLVRCQCVVVALALDAAPPGIGEGFISIMCQRSVFVEALVENDGEGVSVCRALLGSFGISGGLTATSGDVCMHPKSTSSSAIRSSSESSAVTRCDPLGFIRILRLICTDAGFFSSRRFACAGRRFGVLGFLDRHRLILLALDQEMDAEDNPDDQQNRGKKPQLKRQLYHGCTEESRPVGEGKFAMPCRT